MKKYMIWIALAVAAVLVYMWWKKKRLTQPNQAASAAAAGTQATGMTTRAQPTYQLTGAGNANSRQNPGQMIIVNPLTYKKKATKPVVYDSYIAPGFKIPEIPQMQTLK